MSDSILDEKQVVNESEPEFVPKKAYAETQADMFKYKSKLKETEALLNQLKAEKEQSEVASLKDNEQWKTLYEKNQAKLAEIESQRLQERDQFINFHKKNAVLKEIGGFKKDEYSNFIDIKNVEMDETGNVIKDSLLAEVNRIKQQYPELIKAATANNLPSDAPKSFETNNTKAYSQMNEREKAAYRMSLITKK